MAGVGESEDQGEDAISRMEWWKMREGARAKKHWSRFICATKGNRAGRRGPGTKCLIILPGVGARWVGGAGKVIPSSPGEDSMRGVPKCPLTAGFWHHPGRSRKAVAHDVRRRGAAQEGTTGQFAARRVNTFLRELGADGGDVVLMSGGESAIKTVADDEASLRPPPRAIHEETPRGSSGGVQRKSTQCCHGWWDMPQCCSIVVRCRGTASQPTAAPKGRRAWARAPTLARKCCLCVEHRFPAGCRN